MLCTGVRLDGDWITLKASCIEGRAISKSKHRYRVAIGYLAESHLKSDVRLREIRQIVIHPEYKRKGKSKYDLALIQLTPMQKPTIKYDDSPCIMSHQDLKKAIKAFKTGFITSSPIRANEEFNWIDVVAAKIKLAPTLCSSEQYICSKFTQLNRTAYNIDNAPIYVRYGIRDIDWGLAGLTTLKWRTTKSGHTVIHKHTPLYAYINWFDYVMRKNDNHYV